MNPSTKKRGSYKIFEMNLYTRGLPLKRRNLNSLFLQGIALDSFWKKLRLKQRESYHEILYFYVFFDDLKIL